MDPRNCVGSSTPGSIISSHTIPMLLEPEPLIVMNYLWMSREVRWWTLCLLAPSFQCNGLQMVNLQKFSQWAWPGAPQIMLEYYLRPD